MYDEDLANLEESLRRLKVECHIFFTGNRKKPPDDLRLRVEKLVKKLSECSDMSLSQRFRFTTLITRFHVHRDLWRRTLNEKEMVTGAKPDAGSDTHPAIAPAQSQAEAARISISDPQAEEGKVQELYNALLNIRKKNAGEAPIPYRQFAEYIATRTNIIRNKYGCSAVAFTLTLEEGAIRFTAAAESS